MLDMGALCRYSGVTFHTKHEEQRLKEKTLVIYLEDNVYAERFMNYCNNFKEVNLRALAFSEKEGLLEYLTGSSPDCILCDEATKDVEVLRHSKAVRVLTEDEPGSTGLSKYMSAKNLILKLLEEFFEEDDNIPNTGRVVGFFGLFDDGTTGEKAAAFAKGCKEETLLLSFSPFFEGETSGDQSHHENLSELLFALTGETEPDIASFAVKQNGYDAVFGVSYVQDLDDLSTECAKKLCDLLEKSKYSRIAVDFGGFHGFMPVIAGACDRIIVEKTGKDAERSRLMELERELGKAGFPKVYKNIAEAYGWNKESLMN